MTCKSRMIEIWDENNGDRCHVHVEGDMDINSTPELRRHLDEVLARRGTREIIVHLDRTGYLDSTAVGVLMGAMRRARESGAELLLAGVERGPARTMMDLAPLLNVFPIWDDNK
jgi:anti-sigma B factor antagonist